MFQKTRTSKYSQHLTIKVPKRPARETNATPR